MFDKDAYYFGDTGVEQATTENLKLKLGYDFGEWSSLLNIAYEDRNTLRDSPDTYLTSAQGDAVWSGGVTENNLWLSVPTSRLSARELERRSLSSGLRIKGDLTEGTRFEANIIPRQVLKIMITRACHCGAVI